MEALAPLVDEVRAIARRELPDPRTFEMRIWDDGTYDVYVYHVRGERDREQVVYDPETGVVQWQRRKLDPDWEFPDPNEVSEEEWRQVVPEYEAADARRLAVIEPPTE